MKYWMLGFCLIFSNALLAQKIYFLKNASFEGEPRQGAMPGDWDNCGFDGETPPDLQPSPDPANPYFGVQHYAIDGATYVSLSTRDNNTWESMGQSLSEALLPGRTYEFSVYLAQSETFESISRKTGDRVMFTKPVVLKIFGGNADCEKVELLGETTPVDHWEWMEYRFTFQPEQAINYLIFDVFYESLIDGPYNGHILMDHASRIIEGGFGALAETYMAYTPTQLYDYVKACGADRRKRPLYELPERLINIESIYEVIFFEELVSKSGLRQFITSQSVASLSIPIKCLEFLKMDQTAALVKEMGLIQLRAANGEEVSKEELDRFEQCDELILELLQTENPRAMAIQYIEANKKAVVDDLILCE